MPMNAGATWDVDPAADNTIIGGHSVDLVGYETDGTYVLISWGDIYYMTPAFLAQFCDEAYMLADAAWIATTGQTPAGLTLAQLTGLMASMKWNGVSPMRRHRHHRRIKRRTLRVG
jgi:hypothetical protein